MTDEELAILKDLAMIVLWQLHRDPRQSMPAGTDLADAVSRVQQWVEEGDLPRSSHAIVIKGGG